MITFKRDELKKLLPELIKLIQDTHEMGPEIFHELYVLHTPVVNLTHQRGYFKIFRKPPPSGDLYIQYHMDHSIRNVELKMIGRAVQEVTVYETYLEYEKARVSTLNSMSPQKQEGLNLN